MSGLDFNHLHKHTTSELLGCVCELGMENRRTVVAELQRRHADREQFQTELQGANTKLVYENRALREFLGNRVPEWVADVVVETERAKRKHGDNKYNDVQRLAILMEEVGEVANVMNRLYVPPISAMLNVPRELQNLRAELVQVASVSARWVERIDLVAVTLDAVVNGAEDKGPVATSGKRTKCTCDICKQWRARRDAADETISPSNSPESFGLDPHGAQTPSPGPFASLRSSTGPMNGEGGTEADSGGEPLR